MEKNAKISGTQVSMLMFVFVSSTIIIYVPGFTAKEAKESAWLAASILPFTFGFITLWVIYKLGSYFPKLTIFQYCEVIMGEFLGKCFGIIYIIFLLVMDVLVLREFSDFLVITTLPLTPRIWLLASIVAVATYGAYKGLEVIVRAVQFILGIYLLGFLLSVLFALTNFEAGRLLPIMEEGLLPIIRGSMAPSSWYGEICLLAMLFPFVNKPVELKRKGFIALFAITLFVTVDVAVTIGVLGSGLTSALAQPFWVVTRSIEIGEVVQRLESFLLVFWISGIIIKATLLSYLICLGLTQVFGWKRLKVVLGISAISELFIAEVLLGNASQVSVILSSYWPPFAMVFELVIPTFLLGIFKVRKKHLGG
ncbi:GerAB/ArcD/ProY family transporter [Desulfosporosinus metallidurans]|uniref:Spore germination protein GerKB n=1 Tax=Desulfosporosinus metallidurans TaxID=1888891 RepID=A0A1Q8R0D4_9FIRM|nr:endospore germination permease [Desulfosporosinus metallidurans]OLN33089.1 Spore germination protein GerKB [Desulfosporosinus metallidurans]